MSSGVNAIVLDKAKSVIKKVRPYSMVPDENLIKTMSLVVRSIEEQKVRAAITELGFSDDEAIVVPGWFNDTLPVHVARLSQDKISVLRIDCDWYDPVLFVLNKLAPSVSEEGAIILDDYYAWDGCARAAHDYLSANQLSWRIRSMDNFYGAWMINRAHRKDSL